MRGIRGLGLAAVLAVLAAAPVYAAAPTVVAAGDVACDPGSASFEGGAGTFTPAPGKCHMQYTADLIAGLAPDHVLGLGDLQNNNGTLAKYQASYHPSWGRFKAITKPVPGNHDYASSDQDFDPDAPGYRDYFSDVLAPFGPAAQDPRRGWYSFDAGAWHIVALNSECAAGAAAQVVFGGSCAAGSEQERWLRADLAASSADCTLAFWHHPLMTSNDRSLATRPLWDALYDDYADVVLSGHRHTYERFAPQGGGQGGEPGRGIRQFVVGTGGEIMHPFVRGPAANSEVRDNTTFGVLALTLHGPGAGHPRGWYEWRFAGDGRSASTFADSGAGECVGPPTQAVAATAAPASASASAEQSRLSPAADRTDPVVSRARLSRARFRVGRGATARSAAAPRGTAIAYTLSEAATVTLRMDRVTVVRKRGKRVRRYRRAGTLTRKGRPGRRRVAFSGRIARKALAKGSYRLTIAAKDGAGNASRARRLTFTVVN